MQSLLQIVQAHSRRTGLPVPGAIIGTQNAGFLQLQALLEEVGDELASRFTWTELRRPLSHTALAAADQGSLISLCGDDFERIIPSTMWNTTTDEPILGPITVQEYRELTVRETETTPARYLQFNGHLYLWPAPTAGDTIVFYWQSKAWVVSASGTTTKLYFTDDGDKPVFDEALMKLGLRYKWKQEKGLPYAEEMRAFETMAMDKAARTGTQGPVSMAGGPSLPDPRNSVGLPPSIP